MKKMKTSARWIQIVCAALLVIVLFVPIWRIELNAPQYPEGLSLLIHANGLRGNVDIINGLNHYIGMHTLHSEDFIEFTLLPYIVSVYALLFAVVAVAGRRKLANIAFALFVLFGIIAMIDFWQWEYNYGHNLNPNAAIVVPGMAYQPPLIGFKQLLNFGAYSIPDIGGWLFIIAGALFLASLLVDSFSKTKKKIANKKLVAATALCIMLFSTSCKTGTEPLKLGSDACYSCKMTITDARFGAELITQKGKLFKFDDMHCLKEFMKSNFIATADIKEIWLVDYSGNHALINAEQSFLLQSDALHAPMNGKTVAFSSTAERDKAIETIKGNGVNWNDWIK